MSEKPVALVTGGGTGIGAACCRELKEAGFCVGIHYRASREPAERLCEELGDAFCVQADLATREGCDAVYAELKGRGGLAALVNNAGMTVDAPLISAKLEDFERVVATNLRGTWYLTKRLARLMLRKRRGAIVNVTSVVGSTGNPTQSVYAMTKAALDNLTKTAAQELAAYGIRVNAVAPGFIRTRMTEALSEDVQQAILARVPLGRMGEPEEIARFVRFLIVEGTYCTGTVFHVNGGLYGG